MFTFLEAHDSGPVMIVEKKLGKRAVAVAPLYLEYVKEQVWILSLTV